MGRNPPPPEPEFVREWKRAAVAKMTGPCNHAQNPPHAKFCRWCGCPKRIRGGSGRRGPWYMDAF